MLDLDIHYRNWFDAIKNRRSRRSFDSRDISLDLFERLNTFCNEFKPFENVRAVISTEYVDMVFKGAIAHYGKIKGAPAFVAFIGNTEDPNVQEKVGYFGEGIILEATYLGIGSCWVGGFFKPEVVASVIGLRKGEKVFAITPLGYPRNEFSLEEKFMTGFGMTHKRKPLSELVSGLEQSKWPQWIRVALESARLAPSAVNRQPWRFYVEPEKITISVDNLKDTYKIPKRLDCGISMLHVEVGASYCGVKGKWEFLSPPEVASFIANPENRDNA